MFGVLLLVDVLGGVDVVRGVVLGDVDREVAVGESVGERRVAAMRKRKGYVVWRRRGL